MWGRCCKGNPLSKPQDVQMWDGVWHAKTATMSPVVAHKTEQQSAASAIEGANIPSGATTVLRTYE